MLRARVKNTSSLLSLVFNSPAALPSPTSAIGFPLLLRVIPTLFCATRVPRRALCHPRSSSFGQGSCQFRAVLCHLQVMFVGTGSSGSSPRPCCKALHMSGTKFPFLSELPLSPSALCPRALPWPLGCVPKGEDAQGCGPCCGHQRLSEP